jgi:hypothetical protein
MTIHFRNKCELVDDIKCFVPCNTKWNKRQPYLVMQGFAKNLTIKLEKGKLIGVIE